MKLGFEAKWMAPHSAAVPGHWDKKSSRNIEIKIHFERFVCDSVHKAGGFLRFYYRNIIF